MEMLSKNGSALIAKFEGTKIKDGKHRMYVCPTGHPTIGYGHKLTSQELKTGIIIVKGKPFLWKEGLHQLIAEMLLDQDTDFFEAMVNKHVKVSLTQNQFDALVSWAFNIPVNDFLTSKLLKSLNAKKYSEVPAQLKRWVYGKNPKSGIKIKIRGLENRRVAEAALWEGKL